MDEHGYTVEQLRAAAQNCIGNPQTDDDIITAESLIESLDRGSTAANIAAADVWFNKPRPRLPDFMQRYGA